METSLETLVQYFEDAEHSSRDSRQASERVRDYVDGYHWTKQEINELKKRGQPAHVFNFCKDKVNFILGYERQTKTDPKAYPRNPQDDEAAEAATDALRYVQENANLEEAFSGVCENMSIEGYGGLELLIEEKKTGRKEITVKHWPWDRLFYDPHSSLHDFSDARYMGGYVWKDLDDLLKQYPDQKDEIHGAFDESTQETNETYEDKPRDIWSSQKGNRKRVQVVQMYFKQGDEWYWAHLTKGGFLAEPKPVPFVDDCGSSFCPLFLQSAYIDRNNRRYGEIENIIDLNEAYNHALSRMTWLSVASQTKGEIGAVMDVNEFKRLKQRPDSHMEFHPGKDIQEVDQSQKMQLTANILGEARNTLELMGPNAALQGKQGDSASGKAIIASQQGGVMNLTSFFGRFRHLKLRVYRSIWFLIQKYWDEERWVRVTDNDGNAKFAGLNMPMQDEMGEPIYDENQMPVLQNVTSEMDMDIILEEAPDTVTIQQEQFQQLVEIGRSGAAQFPGEVYIKASSLRNKEELLEVLKGGGEEIPPEQAQIQQFMQELQIRGAEAQVAKDEGSAAKAFADAQKTTAEIPIALQNF